MRIIKPNRRQRRGQPIDQIVRSYQIRRINAWSETDAAETDRQIERIGQQRTLKLDEQAKSRTAPSSAAVTLDSAKWNEHTVIEEHRDDYLIPRQSLTSRLFLRLFKPILEFRDTPFRQLDVSSKARLANIQQEIDKRTSILHRIHPDNREGYAASLRAYADTAMAVFLQTATYIAGTNQSELIWKSDTTLLNTRKGYDTLQYIDFQRTTSRTKERLHERETEELPCKIAADGTITWQTPTGTSGE